MCVYTKVMCVLRFACMWILHACGPVTTTKHLHTSEEHEKQKLSNSRASSEMIPFIVPSDIVKYAQCVMCSVVCCVSCLVCVVTLRACAVFVVVLRACAACSV